MDEYDRIAALGELYRLHKEAKVLKSLAKLPGNILKVIDAGAVGAGKETSKLLGGGVRGAAGGTIVRMAPYLAAGGAAMHAGAGEYMKGKLDEFRARQYATRPYYDPQTQRFI